MAGLRQVRFLNTAAHFARFQISGFFMPRPILKITTSLASIWKGLPLKVYSRRLLLPTQTLKLSRATHRLVWFALSQFFHDTPSEKTWIHTESFFAFISRERIPRPMEMLSTAIAAGEPVSGAVAALGAGMGAGAETVEGAAMAVSCRTIFPIRLSSAASVG